MPDSFKLPIDYKGEEKEYPAQIFRFGFTHKVQVEIDSTMVTFEPDEEGNYRATLDSVSTTNIPKDLLKEISETLGHFLLKLVSTCFTVKSFATYI